ncbi:MAG: hypothetical protein J1E40_08445 [Oscillospiraceae bacterium]|nr:hypothetical protein [Oscillospiraceae bacterium]
MKTSYKVSLGGVIASLCLVMMFLTAVFPLLSITLPLFAGALVAVVAIEVSRSWAFVTYAVISILAFFVTPDKDAWLFFTFLFGYYPILKSYFEEFKLKPVGILCKFAVFDASVTAIFYILMNIFGTLDLFEEFGFYNEWLIPMLFVFGNLVFIMYDYVLTILVSCYKKWFRPTFLRKFK